MAGAEVENLSISGCKKPQIMADNGHHSPTVLLVEDETTLRSLLVRQLRQIGYRVIEASNGKEALDLFAENSEIDLLVTDLMMPYMGGIELVNRVRTQKQNLPVLFISGYLDSASSDLAKIKKPFSALRKPFTLRVLAEEVETILSS